MFKRLIVVLLTAAVLAVTSGCVSPSKLAEVQADLEQESAARNEVVRELDAARQANADLELDLQKAADQIRGLQSDLDAARAEVASARNATEEDIAKLEDALKSARDQLQKSKQQMADCRRQLDGARANLEKAKSDARKATEDMNAALRERNSLRDGNDKLTVTVQELRKELAQIKEAGAK